MVRLLSVGVSHRFSRSRGYISASDSSDAALNNYALLIVSGDMAVGEFALAIRGVKHALDSELLKEGS